MLPTGLSRMPLPPRQPSTLGESSSWHLSRGALTDRCSNLSWSTDEQALRDTFKEFGEIQNAVSSATRSMGVKRRVLTEHTRPLS